MIIRRAKKNELEKCYGVIEDAKRVFRDEGSTQWQDYDGYPNLETLTNDYLKNELYVVIDKEIVAVFVFSLTKEECYKNIQRGKWLTNDDNYGVLHRIAVLSNYRKQGIGLLIMKYIDDLAEKYSLSSIKVDTMENNKGMISLLFKANYKECGIIHLLRKDVLDSKRIAFEKVMED